MRDLFSIFQHYFADGLMLHLLVSDTPLGMQGNVISQALNSHGDVGNSLATVEGGLKAKMLKLFSDSEPGLKAVENRMRLCFSSESKLLSEISTYLLELGGKRVRPILALSTARLFGMLKPSQALIDAAAGIEMIHMATLLHDDIIDESPIRRHKVSPFKRYGTAPTLLAGDFLLARAFGLCAHLDQFVIEGTERACIELTEGEILEGTLAPDEVPSLEKYITVVERKTASLFLLAASVGPHLAGASAADVERMKCFGRDAGIAFQMVDDILDVTAEEDLLGKATGTDLKQKTPSLVNVLWLLSGDKKAKEFFNAKDQSAEETKVVAHYLRTSAIIGEAKLLAAEYGARAKKVIMELECKTLDSGTREELIALVDYTLERCA